MGHVLRKQTGIAILLALFVVQLAYAMSDEHDKEFRRIRNLSMEPLTEESDRVLEKKYPNEDWSAYPFPAYVYTNDSVEVGYKIATKRPELLSKVRCACLCKFKGHRNLLFCFYKDGKAGGEFDSHGAGCNVCYRQAMMAFLWEEAGFSEEEIVEGMKEFASN